MLESDDKDILMYSSPCIEHVEWYSEKWYSWNWENWGTKWDANEVMIGSCNGECIELHFDSAWSPAIALYEYLVEDGCEVRSYYYSEVRSYYKERMQFCG